MPSDLGPSDLRSHLKIRDRKPHKLLGTEDKARWLAKLLDLRYEIENGPWSASERMGWYTRQSSINSQTCESTTLGRSFIWSKNNNGPKTVPWGTPESTIAHLNCLPSTTTRCTLFFKNPAVQLRIVPVMPKTPVSPTCDRAELCQMLWRNLKQLYQFGLFDICKSLDPVGCYGAASSDVTIVTSLKCQK